MQVLYSSINRHDVCIIVFVRLQMITGSYTFTQVCIAHTHTHTHTRIHTYIRPYA